MATVYKDLATQIKAVLDALGASVLPVTYKYLESSPTTFPAGMIYVERILEDNFLDTATNEVTLLWTIRAVFPQEETAAAEAKWTDFLEAVQDSLRSEANQTLGGNAVLVKMAGSDRGFTAESYIQPVAYYDIFLTTKVLKSI